MFIPARSKTIVWFQIHSPTRNFYQFTLWIVLLPRYHFLKQLLQKLKRKEIKWTMTEAYRKACQTSKMERFAIFTKCLISDVWQGSEYSWESYKTDPFGVKNVLQNKTLPILLSKISKKKTTSKIFKRLKILIRVQKR